MKKLKAFWDGLVSTLPIIWGVLWLGIITLGSVALLIQCAKWLLMAVGVI